MDVFEIIDSFLYPLLSDNKKLIERYMSYNDSLQTSSFACSFGKAVQSAYLGNDTMLAESIEGLKKWSKRGFARSYAVLQ